MNNYDKILELLQKDKLSEEDKNYLDSLADNDNEVREFLQIYGKIENAAKTSFHLSYDDLSNYILYKKGMEPEDKDFAKKIPAIEDHLKKCSECKEELELLSTEYTGIEKFVAGQLNKTQEPKKERLFAASFLKKYSVLRYSISALLILGFLYIGLFAVSSITTPGNYKFAVFNGEYEFSTTRGRSTDDFQNSLKALENKKYLKAIEFLNKDIKENSSDETIFYSYYILGLTYLEISEKDFLGLFPAYNQDYAEKGLESLQTAVEKNISGLYPNITLDAYFYIAKAELMLNNTDKAKKYFELVVKDKGSKMHESQKILNDME